MFYPERYKRSIERAVEILKEKNPRDELEAYFILKEFEEELELPVIWDIVIEAYNRIKELRKTGGK